MAVPHFVIDAPEGGGKIPLLPADYLVHLDPKKATLRNYEDKVYSYPQPTDQRSIRPSKGNGNGKKRELPMVGGPVRLPGCGMPKLRRGAMRALSKPPPKRAARNRYRGVLASQRLRILVHDGMISADGPPSRTARFQPASLDLRLGETAYRMLSSFLPEQSTIAARLKVHGSLPGGSRDVRDRSPTTGRCWKRATSISFP